MLVRIRRPWYVHLVGQPSWPGWSTRRPPKRTFVPPCCVCLSVGPVFAYRTARRRVVMRTTTAPTVDPSSELTRSKSSTAGGLRSNRMMRSVTQWESFPTVTLSLGIVLRAFLNRYRIDRVKRWIQWVVVEWSGSGANVFLSSSLEAVSINYIVFKCGSNGSMLPSILMCVSPTSRMHVATSDERCSFENVWFHSCWSAHPKYILLSPALP